MSAVTGEVRAVTRALTLLRLLNSQPGLSLRELHLSSGIPKPTVHRLLRTLASCGLLEPDGMPGIYHLLPQVLQLSCGYTDKALVVKSAAPLLLDVTQRIGWPLALGTLDRDAIVVRYSTMPHSPLAVAHSTLGHRHALLGSAMGHAYLMGCVAAERERLLQDLERHFRRRRAHWRALLRDWQQQRSRGYGLRLPRRRGDSATLAVPVCSDGEALGVLSLTSFGRAMQDAFIARYLPELRGTAERIGTLFRAQAERI